MRLRDTTAATRHYLPLNFVQLKFQQNNHQHVNEIGQVASTLCVSKTVSHNQHSSLSGISFRLYDTGQTIVYFEWKRILLFDPCADYVYSYPF